MTTKIGLISDPHACPLPLRQALDIFAREQVAEVICAGDIAGYFESLDETIELLVRHNCKTIIGNHDQSYLQASATTAKPESSEYLQGLAQTLELEIEQQRILVVHAQPPSEQHGGIKLLDQNGQIDPQQKTYWSTELAEIDYDILIVGHTHQVFAEYLGDIFVVNPGSCAFNHSCMILTLPELSVQTFALSDQVIIKCWNFSMLFPAWGD